MLDRLAVVEFTFGFEDSLRVFIKIAFAAQCTEVIRLSSILRGSCRGFERDVHVANRIVNGRCSHHLASYAVTSRAARVATGEPGTSLGMGALNPRSRSEFVITDTELKAMAAPASIGFRKP